MSLAKIKLVNSSGNTIYFLATQTDSSTANNVNFTTGSPISDGGNTSINPDNTKAYTSVNFWKTSTAPTAGTASSYTIVINNKTGVIANATGDSLKSSASVIDSTDTAATFVTVTITNGKGGGLAWWAWILIIVGVILVILLIVWLVKKGGGKKEEAAGPPPDGGKKVTESQTAHADGTVEHSTTVEHDSGHIAHEKKIVHPNGDVEYIEQ